MPPLEITGVPSDQRPTAAWAAALLRALARDEAAGRRPRRLLEPRLDTWSRFRGRLRARDLLELLFEDAAVVHRLPFDPTAVGGPFRLDALSDALAEAWLKELPTTDVAGPSAPYVEEQAQLLGVPTRMARSELHVVKPHQRVLELPGTGGQLAHHLVSTHRDLTLQGNFTVACGTWQELTLAGVIALDLAAPSPECIVRVEPDDLRKADHPLRQRTFDFVIGLRPDKGGAFQIEDQLAIWFSGAKVVLV